MGSSDPTLVERETVRPLVYDGLVHHVLRQGGGQDPLSICHHGSQTFERQTWPFRHGESHVHDETNHQEFVETSHVRHGNDQETEC